MEEGEEDCIVREVPVVFTRSHTGLHYLLQVRASVWRVFRAIAELTIRSVSFAPCLARHCGQQCQQLQVQAHPAAAENRRRN
jgi:hypothetical protein